MTSARIPLGRVVRWLLLTGLALIVILFATVGVLYFTRGTPPSVVHAFGEPTGPPHPGSTAFARTVALLTGTALEPDHRVEPILNGTLFPRLWRDLRSARRSINIQIYYATPGAVADTLKAVLLERSTAGVPVRLLYDAFGAAPLTSGWVDSLQAGGVRVAVFRPVRWYTLHKAQNRSHVRAVVIDGEVGYTGGFGIDDRWQGDGTQPDAWRETNVRFRGHAVGQLQAAFATAWAEATGELLVGPLFFPDASSPAADPPLAAGAAAVAERDTARDSADDLPDTRALAGLLYSIPSLGGTSAGRLLSLLLAGARERLWLTNAYAVPGPDLRSQLIGAAARGVDVRLIVPGEQTDLPIVRNAGRSLYEALLEGGVRIYEYQPTMVHAKTIVADGVWSVIGSLNLDNRSLALNEESVLLVQDPSLGGVMDSLFLADLGRAEEIRMDSFRQRGWMVRLREWVAGLWTTLL